VNLKGKHSGLIGEIRSGCKVGPFTFDRDSTQKDVYNRDRNSLRPTTIAGLGRFFIIRGVDGLVPKGEGTVSVFHTAPLF
jgi:hypothetical protein